MALTIAILTATGYVVAVFFFSRDPTITPTAPRTGLRKASQDG
jgi:hypothetical protein